MRQPIWAATAIAAQQMKTPLSRATLALAAQLAPTTARLSAYVSASPKLSSVPESKDEDPLTSAPPTIIRNVTTLITSTQTRTRFCCAFSAETSSSVQQQLSFTLAIPLTDQEHRKTGLCVSLSTVPGIVNADHETNIGTISSSMRKDIP